MRRPSTVGKNATDSALIIDAMALPRSDAVDGFCIVSSDSDYTRLATRIREQGFFVMGIGRSGTPKSFVNAWELFVYTEILSPRSVGTDRIEDTVSAEWTETAARRRDGHAGMVGPFSARSATIYDIWTRRSTLAATAINSCPPS